MDKQHFVVPFAEKDQAKALGARWDAQAGFWYATTPTIAQDMGKFWAVLNHEPLEALLPGEDRGFGGNHLFVDLVPQSCWFTNVRSCIDTTSWARLSRLTRERANHRCEICGAMAKPASKVYLEAHERWDYNPTTSTQALRRIITLCTLCHLVTHWGYARVSGREHLARKHFQAVSKMDDHAIDQHVIDAFEVWKRRSQRAWQLDLSILSLAGLVSVKPTKA